MINANIADDGSADPLFIREAIQSSNGNILRLALYQATRNPTLAAMKLVEIPGGRYGPTLGLSQADTDILQDMAFDFLLGNRKPVAAAPPAAAEVRELTRMFSGRELSPNELGLAWEELAFETFPRDVAWQDRPSDDVISRYHVIIIGAGISGIAAAIQLKRLGIPFTVLERQAGIGGTWHLNTYPRARVDTTSFLYQFKFEKNYPWSELFASRAETQKYLEHVVEKYDVGDRFHFGREVTAVAWDESGARWTVTTAGKDGSEESWSGSVVISATGLFSTPNLPDITGLADFDGPVFHTAQWDHNVDCNGKRIALIGTGSTGTQLAPGLADIASQLTVYQRTPNWIFGVGNYGDKVNAHLRWLLDNMPYYWNWYSYSAHNDGQVLQDLQSYDREWQSQGGVISRRNDALRDILVNYVRTKIGDDEALIARLIPNYPPLVRRLVVDSGFYEMLKRDNVDLVTEGIDHVTSGGIRSRDGVERAFDIIVVGAGFKVSRYLWPADYVGRNGATLEASWRKDGARAYLGMTMPGFPNFFMMFGPNAAPRTGSLHSFAEMWARYIASAIVRMIERGARSIEIKPDAFDAYNRKLDEENESLIWESAGASYYVNEHGRSGVNMPWTTQDYHNMTRHLNEDDYIFV